MYLEMKEIAEDLGAEIYNNQIFFKTREDGEAFAQLMLEEQGWELSIRSYILAPMQDHYVVRLPKPELG